MLRSVSCGEEQAFGSAAAQWIILSVENRLSVTTQ